MAKVPLHGLIFVEDRADALLLVLKKGKLEEAIILGAKMKSPILILLKQYVRYWIGLSQNLADLIWNSFTLSRIGQETTRAMLEILAA